MGPNTGHLGIFHLWCCSSQEPPYNTICFRGNRKALKIYLEKLEFMRLCSVPRINSEQQELPVGKRKDKINCIRIKKVQSSKEVFLKFHSAKKLPVQFRMVCVWCALWQFEFGSWASVCPVSLHASDLMHRITPGLAFGSRVWRWVRNEAEWREMLAVGRRCSSLCRLENRSAVTPKFFQLGDVEIYVLNSWVLLQPAQNIVFHGANWQISQGNPKFHKNVLNGQCQWKSTLYVARDLLRQKWRKRRKNPNLSTKWFPIHL